ncbi:MAG TPA: hypothetical protein VG754_01240 [Verrucomicrobiae bacterium]|jgi:hypothetical protein|nr:hypothetical protein [Verrucomicrobiae bacterium]
MIAFVHLVRARNGIEPLRRFLDSYTEHPSNVAHKTLIVFKGFERKVHKPLLEDCRALLKSFDPAVGFVRDWMMLDLDAYGYALRRWRFDYYVFVNSFSIIRAPGWMDKLYAAITLPGVGLASCTGSFESRHGNRLLNRLLFPPFPNPHIRTNAFIISRDLMLKVWPRGIFFKPMSYLFESGRWGLTSRVEKLGFRIVLVGNEGIYEKDQWPSANLFRSEDMSNLLVSDNQTHKYAASSGEEKACLRKMAWGI